MKYCPDCQIDFEDNESVCCYCGMPLRSKNNQPSKINTERTAVEKIDPVLPTHDIQFVRNYGIVGRRVEINGIVDDVDKVQYYQSKFTKLWRAVFSGEPYQLGHTTFESRIRVSEIMPEGFSRQAIDVVLYGNAQNIISKNDDLRIDAVRKGNRLVARRIYNNATNSYISIQPNIPAGIFRAIIILLIFVIYTVVRSLIGAVESTDFNSLGDFILTEAIRWTFVIAVIIFIFKFIIKNLFK